MQLAVACYLSLSLILNKFSLGLGIFCLIVDILFLLFVTNLLVFHTFLSCTNTTTWECLSWKKISYMKMWPRRLGSPFNIGIRNNLKLYCCYDLNEDNFLVWRMPRRRPDKLKEPKPVDGGEVNVNKDIVLEIK